MWFASFTLGLTLFAGLIVAIGAQNLFVLQQGLLQRHVGPVVAFCIVCDIALTAAGVFGLSKALTRMPVLAPAMTLAGTLFLGWYGVKAFRRATNAATVSLPDPLALGATLKQAAGFTLLNPHVYLDTVLLVGSIGAAQPVLGRPWFVLGAATASSAWFLSLGFGARLLAPIFARPAAWRMLDAIIGLTMLVMAAGLLAAFTHQAFRPG
jgi:L-lysine exporter family protein LysE/ArgO